MAAGHSVGPGRWDAETDRLLGRMAARFPRVETRRRVRGFVLGLLADLPRKNCWTIAEHAGEVDPHGMQYLLAPDRLGSMLPEDGEVDLWFLPDLQEAAGKPARTGRTSARAAGRPRPANALVLRCAPRPPLDLLMSTQRTMITRWPCRVPAIPPARSRLTAGVLARSVVVPFVVRTAGIGSSSRRLV